MLFVSQIGVETQNACVSPLGRSQDTSLLPDLGLSQLSTPLDSAGRVWSAGSTLVSHYDATKFGAQKIF